MCVRARVRVCVRACACVRACVRACAFFVVVVCFQFFFFFFCFVSAYILSACERARFWHLKASRSLAVRTESRSPM